MEEKKLSLEDVIRYRQMLNPVKLAIVLILYTSEVLEEMEMERRLEGGE